MSERVQSPREGAQASSTARHGASPIRQRPLRRASTMAELASAADRRRGSFMTSDSADRASLRSSTEDFLLPRAAQPGEILRNDPSPLHSAPLVLALLPAVGGLLFKNGSAIFTDVTLLVLAAILLNWSVRLPW